MMGMVPYEDMDRTAGVLFDLGSRRCLELMEPLRDTARSFARWADRQER